MEAFALVALRLSRTDFWGTTAAEFREIMDVHERLEERTDRRVARILAMMRNLLGARKGGKGATEEDYMPRRIRRQTPEEIARTVHAWHRLLA